MADLEKIQFLRSTVAGKTPTTSQLADGELAINMADYAIYTKNGSSIVQLAGKGIPETNTKKLTVDGPSALNDTVTVAEGKTITFTNENLSGEITRHIVGKCASNDGWYIGSGGTSNNGILEIGTIDDGTETIQFVQRGAGNVEARKLVLLDSSGNTTLPGDLRLSTNKTVKISNGSTLTLEMGVGANDVYIKNLRGSGVLQLTNDGNLSFRNYQVYYAMSGKGPGKDGTLLTNVENARQLEQDNFPISSGTEARWTKVALLKDPGSNQSRLQLMVTNGGNYGSTRGSIDFIDCSARNFPSTLTSANIRNHLQVRRIGDPGIDNTNQMRYSLVRTSEGLELWFMQRAFISSVKVALLSIAGDTQYYLPTGYTTSTTAPEGLVESVAIRIYDEINKPNLDNGTDGILSIAKGGTGASTADAARTNLGLGTAATRDVGEGAGNVLENGAYGLGGNGGKSINDIISNADMLTRLKSYGGTFWRGVTKSGVSVQNGLYSHGSGIFMNAGDTMSAINIDYASAKVRVYAANNAALAAGDVKYNELYGTANKPSKADVGLGNLTNDAQVKKAGDTMSGDLAAPNLHASGPGTASVYVNAGSGNAHVWFRTNANERGVIWATPNTTDLGQINIRAKTTEGVSAGDFSFRSDGRLDVPVAVKVGGAAILTKDGNITSGSMFGGNLNNYLNTIKNDITAGDNKQVSKTGDTMTGNLTINANLKVENPSGTFVDLGSENSDKYSRLTLARKVGSGATVAMLKITPEGYVQFGYQTAVSNPAPSKYILVKSSGLEVEGDLVFNQTYRGTEDAVDISDKTIDLNNMVIKGSDLGTRQLYKCVSSGGGSNIANKPTSDGNFVLEVLSLRKISDSDWTCKQTFTTKSGGVEGTYVRYCNNGAWSAWKEVVAGVQPINLGGTGATSVAAARNNLGVGEGQSVKFGGLVVDGNINVASGNFVIAGQAPTDNSHLTNKKYVDDKVASAISNAGDTYLPLAGGTVTGRLTITGDQLKTTSLWVTGDAAVNGVLTVDGRARFNQEFIVSTSVNVQNTGNSHLVFRKADGTEKGLIWADEPGSVSIRAGGVSGPTWNFWNSGSCQFPGAISNFNGVNSTTNYPGGGSGAYLNTAGLTSRFSNGAYVSLYFQEYVGNYHQAILNVNGYGRDDNFYFRAGGDFFCTRNGSFDNVEIRSDRRAKSDIKVIENALEKVETLSGNTYELHNTSGGTTRSAGLIAQEVQEILPEAVTQDNEEDGGMLRLNYNSVIALLVESVKELSAEVKNLKAEIEELKSK
ncbi:TPA: tail fiber domain-containing protein [Klebsiella pneumoniae]|nr:tail fiber domain-containing protein [Klebsiella pneumoniae]